MKSVGFSEKDLHEIGVIAHLEAVTSMIEDEVKSENEVPYITADHAVLRAVAAMIAKNNQLVSEQLQKLGYLKD